MKSKKIAVTLALMITTGVLFANPNNENNFLKYNVSDTLPKDTTTPKKDTISLKVIQENALLVSNQINVRDTVPSDTIPKKDSVTAMNHDMNQLTAFNFSSGNLKDTIPTDTIPKKDSIVAFHVNSNYISVYASMLSRDTIPSDSIPKKDSSLALNNFVNASLSMDTIPTDSVPKKDSALAVATVFNAFNNTSEIASSYVAIPYKKESALKIEPVSILPKEAV